MKRGGYIALYRSIFDDKTLDDDRFSRREAWVWLLATSAYEPSKHTIGPAAVKVDRGQMATTLRTLAKTWGWSLSRVRRFLDYLKKANRITVQQLPLADTPPGTPQAVLGIVVTVCNYSLFQDAKSVKKARPAHPPALKQQRNLPFLYALKPEEPKKRIDQDSPVSGKGKAGSKPATVKKAENGSVFIPLDHPQYSEFVDDFKTATGLHPEPLNGGNWFWPMGEASRPAKLLHLRARAKRAAQ